MDAHEGESKGKNERQKKGRKRVLVKRCDSVMSAIKWKRTKTSNFSQLPDIDIEETVAKNRRGRK